MFEHVRLVRALGATAALIVTTRAASAQVSDTARARECQSCAEWNTPQRPVHLYGNAYYVGTHGLGSVLLTSPAGHVLIDGALTESAPLIAANIRALGFRVEDVKLILNSHVHFDHAGGIALAYPPVMNASNVTVFTDGDTLRVGSIAVVAHITAGHTPGGTTWSWVSCENDRCESMVYADSQTPVSAELWQRVAKRDAGDAHALEDRDACKRYAAAGRQRLAARLAKEAGKR